MSLLRAAISSGNVLDDAALVLEEIAPEDKNRNEVLLKIAEVSRAKKSIVETFSRAYSSASPDEQALLRVWMRDIIRPQKKPRVDVAKARRFEKDSVEARNRRILEFPVSMSHREVPRPYKPRAILA